MAQFWQSFADTFTPAYRQSLGDANDNQRLKLQMALQEQQRQQEADRQLMDEAAAYGVSPTMGADNRPNRVAMMPAVLRAKAMFEQANRLAQDKAMQDQRDKADLASKARTYGVGDQHPARGWSFMAQPPAQQQPLEQRVADAERAAKIKQITDESEARAKATAPYENIFTQGDNYALNGKPLGRAVRNNRTGEYGIRQEDGSIAPIPEGAVPITPTAINRDIIGLTDFKKLATDVNDSERSLRQIERYANSVGGINQGLSGLADKFTAGMKTLLGGKVTGPEMQRRIAQGQLQGLLGGNRLAVVGGGVLTEQDAQRIIDYLGGDVGAWQNRDQVMSALSQLYQDRYSQYENDRRFYDAAVDSFYGAQGFEKTKPTTFNKLFGAPATNGNVAEPAATAAPSVIPSQSDIDKEFQRRAAGRGR